MADRVLVGREPELRQIDDRLAQALASSGSALVLHGAGGIGKTSLLREASFRARAHGMRVLSVTGVMAEIQLPYAGLRQLLDPLLHDAHPDSARNQETLPAAAGELTEQTMGSYRAARAALSLLTTEAARQPVAVFVDDAQWLDQPSWEALAFVGRRLEADPVVVFFAAREGEETLARIISAGLPAQAVEALADDPAAALLDQIAPALSPVLRTRILREAAGNPLGLIELPAVVGRLIPSATPPDQLPLTARLELNYSLTASSLPAATRSALLVAAVNDSEATGEILAACSALTGASMRAEHFQPAVAAGLLQVDDQQVHFSHPLVRSAISQAAPGPQRLAAHAAIASVLAGQGDDREIWHRAAAAPGPDEETARQLARLAQRARQSGAPETAQRAWEKAAALTADISQRSLRLLWAADAAYSLDDRAKFRELLDGIDLSSLSPARRALALWMRQILQPTGWPGASWLVTMAGVTDHTPQEEEDREQAIESIAIWCLSAWWGAADQTTRQEVLAVLDQLDVSPLNSVMIHALATVAPLERGQPVRVRLAESLRQPPGNPLALYKLGSAASAVGDFRMTAIFTAAAAEGLRASGKLVDLVTALVTQAWAAAVLGDSRLALTASGEASARAVELSMPEWALPARLATGLAEGLRGNTQAALTIADQEEAVILSGGIRPFLALVRLVRGAALLSAGRGTEAFDELYRMFDPADISYHPYVRFWGFTHLIEAAAASGRQEQLAPILAESAQIAAESDWPVVRTGLICASALLAPETEADEKFRAALTADLRDWPFEWARLQLAYGSWLRRQRLPTDARGHLRAAQQTFEALGASPWAERARRELRATGETVGSSEDRTGQLTAQELQIAQLAAAGLSNRDIAEQLYLSPRTISTHLYRIYPKIGAASRRDLGRLLRPAPDESSSAR